MSCSLKNWFNDLPWMQQGVLMGALRNCDGYRSEGPHKILVRGIRGACIKSAQSKGSFNARRPDLNLLLNASIQFVDKHFDHMPIHFVTHLMHAAEVIGYSHPDNRIADVWFDIYELIVSAMHLNTESLKEFQIRLADDPEQVAREDEHDEECYAAENYGDGTGTFNEGDDI